MRKAITIALFVLAIIAIVFSIFISVVGAIEIHKDSKELANTPGTSGSDYLGIVVAKGFFLIVTGVAAIIALIFSAITTAISNIKPIKNCSFIMCLLSVILMFFATLILRLV